MQKLFSKISGVVQHYAWGGYSYIPSLLGRNNTENKPFAEYWLGAHPVHPSTLEGDGDLAGYLKNNPLPAGDIQQGNMLPYLFKILDVRQMLSIQVHPDKRGAEKGFDEEENKRIPLNAANRNYRDRNHKPELMVALGEFYLLHGFKSPEKLNAILDQTTELHFLKPVFVEQGYRGLYEEVMRMPQEKVDTVLSPLASRLKEMENHAALTMDQEDFWAARAIREFCKEDHIDRGIFSIYFFNLVKLEKGEGIFQDHGVPHAYLQGRNVEVMANSDNVLRAGLTEKNIDVEELLKHVIFEPVDPVVLKRSEEMHSVYKAPVEEFELHHYAAGEAFDLNCQAGEMIWVEDGRMELKAEGEGKSMEKGEAVFFTGAGQVTILPHEKLSLFRVLIPGG